MFNIFGKRQANGNGHDDHAKMERERLAYRQAQAEVRQAQQSPALDQLHEQVAALRREVRDRLAAADRNLEGIARSALDQRGGS